MTQSGHFHIKKRKSEPLLPIFTEFRKSYLNSHNHPAAHLLHAVAQDFAQYLVGAVSGAVPGVDFLHVEFAQPLGKGAHHLIFVAEQVEAAQHGVYPLAREGRLDFFHDVVGPGVTAAVHDEQPLRRVEHQALFVVKAVVAVRAVFLDAQVRPLADAFEACGLVRHQVHVRGYLHVAFGVTDSVGEALQPSLADSDVLVIGQLAEKLVRVVAVLGGSLAQVEGRRLVEREESGHAVAVVVMRVAQNADVHLREVHPHHARVLRKQVRGAGIQEVTPSLELHIHGKSPLAEEFAGATIAFDVVYEDLNLHGVTILFAVEAGPFHDAVAAFLGSGELLASIAFDIDKEAELARVLGAASVAVAVGALVVDDGVYGAAVLAQPEGLPVVLVPVLLVDRDDVVLADPLFGLLAFDSREVARPFAAVILDAFLAAGVRPGDVPGQVGPVPDGVGGDGRSDRTAGLERGSRCRRGTCAHVCRNATGAAVDAGRQEEEGGKDKEKGKLFHSILHISCQP